ncbi:MAG: hypothetical protein EOO47_25770 [Flavobacterium sp.]|nr:MAG: hypothetical protein EOO47_25770 [Flavobacterium sp.]
MQEYRTWTYLILFLIIFAETGFVVTPFLPGDSMLFAVGALVAGEGTGLNIWFMLLILIFAAIAGNTVNYRLGKYFGVKVFKENNNGAANMSFGKFTYYNIIGGVAWIGSLLFAGFLLGKIPFVEKNFEILVLIIAVGTFVPVIFAALKSVFSKKPIEKQIEEEIKED